MGPIHDQIGLEQWGKNSDKFNKLCTNSQLHVAQLSGLGVDIGGNIIVASIGQADDVVLLS